MGLVGADLDRGPFEAEVDALLQQVRSHELGDVSVSRVLEAMMKAGSRHEISNPGSLLLLLRAFAISEALLKTLAPEMDMLTVFQRQMKRVQRERYAPGRLLERGKSMAWDLERLLREAPADLRRVLRRLADGSLGAIRAPEVELLARRADRALERLTGGIASAALVTAGSLLAGIPGWHRSVGDALLALGLLGTFGVAIGAWRSR
jgi:ubiquinone biosynthesis protein